jgi:non-ribosomal peptide synthetase-like protein
VHEAAAFLALVAALSTGAWWRYCRIARDAQRESYIEDGPVLTDRFSERARPPHSPFDPRIRWLHEVFERAANVLPDHPALSVPLTGEHLSYTELNRRADAIAAALMQHLDGPDQVVGVAIAQDNADIVAAHLGILKAGATQLFLDPGAPASMIAHMLADARPVVVLTRGQRDYAGLPTIDLCLLETTDVRLAKPHWLDEPRERLAAIFYTSGTTGTPKGVECAHAGYVNLARSYADYFDFTPGYDATSLTSSLGYDGSISEMYSAWSSGCEVVLLTKDQVRSGPDLVPVLIAAEVTALFCPPVLLSTLTAHPEHDLPYPICRYVIPAGEAFPASLVEPWTRARRQIINTYGPTEASTDTSRQSLRPGQPVTIGSPFANVEYLILDPDTLTPIPHGEAGELCIGGVHLARGYRNRPDETAARFIDHPEFGRLYRTGDRCHIDPDCWQVHFHGRIDAQLKVRGHRVEVQPIEDLMQREFDAIETAVLDYRDNELIAFIAAPSLEVHDEVSLAPEPLARAVQQRLAEDFPDHAVPSRLFVVRAFALKLLSGKIDRNDLPSAPVAARNTTSAEPSAAITSGVPDAALTSPDALEALALCREAIGYELDWDDRFVECGGHSLAIAQLAQQLQNGGWCISVRELLSTRGTARAVASAPRRQQPVVDADPEPILAPAFTDERGADRYTLLGFTALQVFALALIQSPSLVALALIITYGDPEDILLHGSLVQFLAAAVVVFFLWLAVPFFNLAWVLTLRRLSHWLVGNSTIEPGVYPKWSRMHFRVWWHEKLQSSVLRPMRTWLRSNVIYAWVLRQLGARVGCDSHCSQDAEYRGPLRLLSIEDGVTVQPSAQVASTCWVDGALRVDGVRLGAGSTIGVRAVVGPGADLGGNTWVAPLTPVLDDSDENDIRDAGDGRCTGKRHRQARPRRLLNPQPTFLQESANFGMQLMLELSLTTIPGALVVWWFSNWYVQQRGEQQIGTALDASLAGALSEFAVLGFAAAWVTLVLTSVLSCLFLRLTRTHPRMLAASSLAGALVLYRQRKMDQIQRLWSWSITGQYLRSLAGIRYSRTGASECDSMFNLLPELVSADAQAFWAQGCFSNVVEQDQGLLLLRTTDQGPNFFVGNNAVIERGTLPDNLLVGVSTPASDIRFRRQVRTRENRALIVGGNPPLQFGEASTGTETLYDRLPNVGLFLARVLLNDVLRVALLPSAVVLFVALITTAMVFCGFSEPLSAVLAVVLAETVVVIFAIVVKLLLVGSRWGRDHQTHFWSLRHFVYFFAQDCFLSWCSGPLRILEGTLMSNLLLRRFGCRIGHHALINTPMQAFDWNAVDIGEDCVVEGMLQLHSFENGLLKVSASSLGDHSTLSIGATLMGGASTASHCTIEPLALVTKEMRLGPGHYGGSPAQAVSPQAQTFTVAAAAPRGR